MTSFHNGCRLSSQWLSVETPLSKIDKERQIFKKKDLNTIFSPYNFIFFHFILVKLFFYLNLANHVFFVFKVL